MENDIYDLYLSYQDREIDDKFINKVFDCLMKQEQNLWPYIKDFVITNEKDSSLGSYSNENKTVCINRKGINEYGIAPSNILGIQVIKHELEHARNLKKLEQKKDDIESKVILYSLRNYAIEKGIDFVDMDPIDLLMLMVNISTNYETNPGERIAEIKSWKYMMHLLKNQKGSDDLLTAKVMLYYSYIRGYKDNRYYLDCPTYSFLLETKQLRDLRLLKQRIDESDYSLNTRLLCGLPITYKEYNEETFKKAKIRKKLITK